MVAPPHHGAVPGDEHFFGVEGPFTFGVEELPEQRPDSGGTLVSFAVRGRRAVDQTVVGESGYRGVDIVTIQGVVVPLDGGPDFVPDSSPSTPPDRAIAVSSIGTSGQWTPAREDMRRH